MKLKTLTDNLKTKRENILKMGGEKLVALQHSQNKLSARERVDLLFDKNTFCETGILAHHQNKVPDMVGKPTPADGVVTGFGKIEGRPACVVAYDFTVMAGSMGEVGERKISDLRKRAISSRMPFIWLLDSAGARIQEAFGGDFAGSGNLFYDQSLMSGQIPLVCAVMGPCAAGTAYIPGLSDVVFMVEKTGSMALAGPHLVKAAIGEDLTAEELGGSVVHCKQSGVGDASFSDDKTCIEAIKEYLRFFPTHSGQKPPLAHNPDLKEISDKIYNIIPDDAKQSYDVHSVISEISDHGRFFEIKKDFAKNIVCGFSHIGGKPVGIVANQPSDFGGVIDIDASDKAARFVNLCDAYNIPLVFLVDTPGFMVGSKVEKAGIIRHGAKFIYQVSNASVPKITIILRKAFGAGYYAMCGKAFGADTIVSWPSGEISVMGAEGALNIIYRKYIEAAPYPNEVREEALRQLREKISPYLSAESVFIDDVIDPKETRKVILQSLESLENKKLSQPVRKRGIPPV